MRTARLASLVLAAGLAAAGLSSCALGGDPAEAETALSALLWPGRTAQAAARIDQRGRVLTPASLRDKVVVLAFVSADCLIPCVVRTRDLDALARALPEGLRDRTAFLALDVDPGRDDAAALRGFAQGFGIEAARLRLVTGDAASTKAAMAFLRYPAARLPEPPATVLVFDRRGQAAMSYGADPLDAPRLLRDIALIETFEDGIGHPARAATPGPDALHKQQM